MLRPNRKPYRQIGLSLAVPALLAAGPSFAAVVEPNGLSVPAASSNPSEMTLQAYFTSQQENINALNDASTDPGAFLPLCDFQATLVLSQSQAGGGIAWYNTTSPAPNAAPAMVYPIGGFPLTVGQTITSTNIRGSTFYAGGLIGLTLQKNLSNQTPPVLTNVYYSEYQRNANCTMCAMPGYWKMALAYRSTRYPNSYYLAFEDWEGANNMTWFGNDGDFNDKVFRIDGVICNGGGEPCMVPNAQGVCVSGVTECQVGAGIICKPAITKSAEKCDNLDNDCNGMVDDGDGLCQAGFICSKGVCIRPCDDTEFPCGPGFTCDTDGLCKDPRCATVDCPAGKVCQNGNCVGGCDGFKCPLGQICQLGICVDPCAGVSCPGAVCEMGACVSACRCRACDTGKVCAMGGQFDGHCVDNGCDKMTCPAGTVCQGGSCKDACTGAVCPGGTTCDNGMCPPPPPITPTGIGGSTGSGSGGGGGFSILGTGGTTGAGGTGGRGGGSGAAGTGVTTTAGSAGAGGTGTGGAKGRGGTLGCGCAVAEAPAGGGLLFAIAAAAIARRRRWWR